MRKIINQVALVLVISAGLYACSKDGTGVVLVNTDKEVNDLRADTIIGKDLITGMPVSAGKYTFYSLERNEMVANSDSASVSVSPVVLT